MMISRSMGIILASGCAALATLAAIFWAELDKARARNEALGHELDDLYDRHRRLLERNALTEKRFEDAMELAHQWQAHCDAVRQSVEAPKNAEVSD